MAVLRNEKAVERFVKDSGSQIVEGVSQAIKGDVQPVLLCNPFPVCNIVRSQTATGGNATIYTTPTDEDFYLTSCSVAIDASAGTGSSVLIRATIGGAVQNIIYAASDFGAGLNEVSPATGSNNMTFPFPIKIDRNTAIEIVEASGDVGFATIAGYTVSD